MRKVSEKQRLFSPGIKGHARGRELVAMSEVLDNVPEVLEMVRVDLIGDRDPDTGRPGLTAEQVLRALVIKQMNGFSYDELAFHLEDSSAYRAFCRFGYVNVNWSPKKSALQMNIKRLKPETLENINRALIDCARQEGIERGRKVRVDTTVTESNIHHPTDSSLLYDVVRVIARIVNGQKLPRGCGFRDHRRRAKRRQLGIANAKNKAERKPLYRDLLKVTRNTVAAGRRVADKFMGSMDPEVMAAAEQLRRYAELGDQVIDQTERRVLRGEKVPATEKIVSQSIRRSREAKLLKL